ncbi:hypothetical protein ACMV5L_01760 [Serratia plymuthica]|uniref:hypothetical protein n=1 Tax=Serratia plymuthica TaxID=82996 RepID=UPI003DA37AA1
MVNSINLIRNANIAKNKDGDFFYFHVDSDLKINCSTLYGRNSSSSVSTTIYTTKKNIIEDTNTVTSSNTLQGVLISIVWCERQAISSLTELHYAEIDDNLKIIRQTTLDDALAFKEHLLARAAIVDDVLLVSWIDGMEQNIKLRLFSLDSLQPLSTELEIDEYLNLNYFNDAQSRTANLTLTSIGNNQFFLQFLLETGSICTYKIAIADNALTSTHLFEQGGENVGFHETLFDKDQQQLLTVYSENKVTDTTNINDIYIISQTIFSEISRHNVSGTPQRVNQSTGFYLRPVIVKYIDQYIILWQGNKLHYIGLNSDLNVNLPEAFLDVLNPARIAIMEHGTLLVSAQLDNWSTIDYGESLFSSEITNLIYHPH